MTEVLIHAPDTEPVPTAIPGKKAAASNWWKIGDVTVLLVYVCITTFTLQYHEKWADEAQAWLLARDLDLKTLWFHELRYEGHPGLWHTILWFAQRVFHAPYSAIGYIGLAFAIAGVAVLIFKAPFPRIVRWPLAFTYFLVYQYAVIARPYNLLPLLCFTAAIFFKDRKHPERLTLILILLAMLTFHGTIIAGCLGAAYLLEAYKCWPQFEERLRHKYVFCIGLMVALCVFLFFILKLPPDASFFAVSDLVKQLQPTHLTKIIAVTSGAFLDFIVPSALFVALSLIWCISRRQYLSFLLPVASLIVFYSLVHGYAHHHGTVFIAAITGLWIAWPTENEQESFGRREQMYLRAMVGLLLVLCAVNIWDAVVVIQREYKFPYSGAEDAANYLKAVGADQRPIFGYMFGMNAVQAYFDHNILANRAYTYSHLAISSATEILNVAEIERVKPGYIIVSAGVRQEDLQPLLDSVHQPLVSDGYTLVHISDGYMFAKRAVYEREVYFIFARTRP